MADYIKENTHRADAIGACQNFLPSFRGREMLAPSSRDFPLSTGTLIDRQTADGMALSEPLPFSP